MNFDSQSVSEYPLLNSLQNLLKDGGSLAQLRRYWSPGTRSYAYPVLGRLKVLGRERLPDAVTAALFAEHAVMSGGENPHSQKGLRIGAAALLIAGGSDKADAFNAGERHFRRLIASDEDSLEDVSTQLRRLIIRLARSKKPLPLDYTRLLWDLRKWLRSANEVKLTWARDFWQAPEAKPDDLIQ